MRQGYAEIDCQARLTFWTSVEGRAKVRAHNNSLIAPAVSREQWKKWGAKDPHVEWVIILQVPAKQLDYRWVDAVIEIQTTFGFPFRIYTLPLPRGERWTENTAQMETPSYE